MKIKTLNGEEINTEKLSDREAEISESINNLYEVCKRYNTTMFASAVVPESNKYIGAQFIMNAPKEKSEESAMFLFGTINRFISRTTNGEIQVVKVSSDEASGYSENQSFE